MPQSSHRHKHHNHPAQHPHSQTIKAKPKRSASLLMAIFIGLVGLVIGAFASNMNALWMTGTALLGVIGGALIGHAIDRSIEKK